MLFKNAKLGGNAKSPAEEVASCANTTCRFSGEQITTIQFQVQNGR
jgi:hypothetical protein